MDPADVERAAELLVAAARSRHWLQCLPVPLTPADAPSAYAIQAAAEARSARVRVGWKVGCTSLEMQQLIGVDNPIAGPIFEDAAFIGAKATVACRPDMALVEGEFAFILQKPLPPREAPYDRASVVSAVGCVLPAIEIVQERYIDWKKSTVLEKIADYAGHGAILLGNPSRKSADITELPDHAVQLKVGGDPVAEGRGVAVLDDPLNALIWLATWLSERGKGLRAGDVVMSGSCTGAVAVSLNAPIVADFGSLGRIELTLVPYGAPGTSATTSRQALGELAMAAPAPG